MLSRVVSIPLTSTAVPDAGGIVSDPTDELAEKAKSGNPNAHCCVAGSVKQAEAILG